MVRISRDQRDDHGATFMKDLGSSSINVRFGESARWRVRSKL